MGRPPLASEIVDAVEHTWGKLRHDADRSGMSPPTGTQVYQEMKERRRKGGPTVTEPSLRKVQQIVRDMKTRGEGRFDPTEWRPWRGDELEAPEDTHFLLLLCALARRQWVRGLYEHEARWARRLRPALERMSKGQMRTIGLELVGMYSVREEVARLYNRPPPTGDLDGLFAFPPWVVGWTGYEYAVKERLVEPFYPDHLNRQMMNDHLADYLAVTILDATDRALLWFASELRPGLLTELKPPFSTEKKADLANALFPEEVTQ